MCGIFGKVVRPGARVTAAELETMGASLRHRGPDAMGVHTDGTAGLGATRLSIIDPAGGRQPVPNAAGDVWAVQNGELYNYIELRARLAEYGNPPVRGGDTAVLPGLYETIGRGFPGALRGMFAIVIWDSRAGRLTRIWFPAARATEGELDAIQGFAFPARSGGGGSTRSIRRTTGRREGAPAASFTDTTEARGRA